MLSYFKIWKERNNRKSIKLGQANVLRKFNGARKSNTEKEFRFYFVQDDDHKLYLGLNKGTSLVESFDLFQRMRLGLFSTQQTTS